MKVKDIEKLLGSHDALIDALIVAQQYIKDPIELADLRNELRLAGEVREEIDRPYRGLLP